MDFIVEANKSFDDRPSWQMRNNKITGRLEYQIALRLNGVLGRGVTARLVAPANTYGEDIYGHIEVNSSLTFQKTARLLAVEYEPKGKHRNRKCSTDNSLSLQTYKSRYYPYSVNKCEGWEVFFQYTSRSGIAAPLPADINSFRLYLNFCAELWKCDDMGNVPCPWEQN